MNCALISLMIVAHVVEGSHYLEIDGYPQSKSQCVPDATFGSDPGPPLYLTPYVLTGKILEGRRQALVHFTEVLGIRSYAGFFTVNELHDSNQFVWYFPAMDNSIDAPVIVWLQGGPGLSSLFGLFNLHGPIMTQNGTIHKRDFTWARNHHVIYIDNPVGAGFSFTRDDEGYCNNEVQIGEHLHSTLTQFLLLFPELRVNHLFVSGESYAGKYVPALAYTIHKRNPIVPVKINLRGISIGNGLSDPINQLGYSKYLYQNGLVDLNSAMKIEAIERKAISFIEKQQWQEAFKTMSYLILDDDSIILNKTGFTSYYNYLYSKDPVTDDYVCLLQDNSIRRNIHVGNLPFHDTGTEARSHLIPDFMQSVAPWISELLNHYHVLIYSGQLDIIIPYPLTLNYLRKLKFNGSEEYLRAERQIWKVGGKIAGYVKKGGRLTEVLVRNAGHRVPYDQPLHALDMITKFVRFAL